MLHRLVVVTVLPLLAIASSVDAQPAAITKPSALPAPAVRVDAGLGSAVGSIGVVYTHPVKSNLAVELGAGYGFSGLQLSAMGKYQRGSGSWRFTPGVGVSVGIPLGTPTFHTGHPNNDEERIGRGVMMRWLDADLLGVEFRSRSGFVFAASAGLTVALNEAHYDFGDVGSDVSFGSPSPQARLGFGKTF